MQWDQQLYGLLKENGTRARHYEEAGAVGDRRAARPVQGLTRRWRWLLPLALLILLYAIFPRKSQLLFSALHPRNVALRLVFSIHVQRPGPTLADVIDRTRIAFPATTKLEGSYQLSWTAQVLMARVAMGQEESAELASALAEWQRPEVYEADIFVRHGPEPLWWDPGAEEGMEVYKVDRYGGPHCAVESLYVGLAPGDGTRRRMYIYWIGD